MDIESSCTKLNLLLDTLAEEIPSCFEGKPSLIIKKNHTNIQFLIILAHEVSTARNQMHCLAIKYFFTSRKMSIDTSMDQMQLKFLENKRCGSLKKTFQLFRSKTPQMPEMFPQKNIKIPNCLTLM